ncbi:MAG: hypothetical protein HOP20_09775 [Sulfuriferula sp.]|nr:hypothetical protein [Sulfuriferula sp.]
MNSTNNIVALIISLETAAMAVLSQDMQLSIQILSYLTLHVSASFLTAVIVWKLLPKQYQQPKISVMSLFFLFALLIPLLSIISMILTLIITRFFSKSIAYQPFSKIALPAFTLGSAGDRKTLGDAAITATLKSTSLPIEKRMKALLASQSLPPRQATPLLKALLGDDADDLRLLAYGMLDNREKTLNKLIHDTLIKLNASNQTTLQHLYHKQLAELYWAFAYEQLAEGDMLTYMLTQAEHYAQLALAHYEDIDLLILSAQIMLKQSNTVAAYQMLLHADGLGASPTRTAPYLAEIAYTQGNYTNVRLHLTRLHGNQQHRAIANIVSFWLGARA